MNASAWKIVKLAAFLVFVCAVAYLLLLTPFGQRLTTSAGRKEFVDRIDQLVRAAGFFGPALFVLIYGVGALALPATPFSIAGSFIFGRYAGAAVNVAGVLLGASLGFVLGRYFLRDAARSLLTGRLGDLDRKAERHGFNIIFYLRIVWFPFIVLNYAAGATAIRFRDYFWGTLLGTLPAVVILSFFFGGLKEIVAAYREPADLLRPDILVPAALLVLSFFIPAAVGRIRGKPPAGVPPTGGR